MCTRGNQREVGEERGERRRRMREDGEANGFLLETRPRRTDEEQLRESKTEFDV